MKVRRWVKAGAVLTAAGFLMVACGSDDHTLMEEVNDYMALSVSITFFVSPFPSACGRGSYTRSKRDQNTETR